MFIYSMRRMLAMIPLLVGITLLNFMLYALTPVDPVNSFIGLNRDLLENRELIEEAWGLNKPIYQRYIDWAIPVFTRLDFGLSWQSGNPVTTAILPFIEKTVLMFGTAFFLTILVSTVQGCLHCLTRISSSHLFSSHFFLLIGLMFIRIIISMYLP